MNKANADYIDNPLIHNGYNMSYEPYASKYDNKLTVGDHRQDFNGAPPHDYGNSFDLDTQR